MVTSEPVNGNRNNVSDSALANSASFKATKGVDMNVGVSNGILRKQDAGIQERLDASRNATNSSSNLDTEPPDLVIISDMDDDKEEEVMPEPTEPDKQVSLEQSQSNGEMTSNQKVYAHVISADAVDGRSPSNSLQSAAVTSAGKDAASSGEDEVEDVDLELIEEDTEPNSTDQAISSSHANSSNPTNSHPSASAVDAKDSSVKKTRLLGHPSHHQSAASPSKKHSRNGHTPSHVYAMERKSAMKDHREGGGSQEHNRREVDSEGTAPVTNVKQASKVKQFFTTIQQHANKLGSEVAEQVQELIHALMVSPPPSELGGSVALFSLSRPLLPSLFLFDKC